MKIGGPQIKENYVKKVTLRWVKKFFARVERVKLKSFGRTKHVHEMRYDDTKSSINLPLLKNKQSACGV